MSQLIITTNSPRFINSICLRSKRLSYIQFFIRIKKLVIYGCLIQLVLDDFVYIDFSIPMRYRTSPTSSVALHLNRCKF